jgi:hypothetical protein
MPSPHFSSKSCPEMENKPNGGGENYSSYSPGSTTICQSMTQTVQMPPNKFKLDHLSDINPKRLYEGSKFRCRVHDVIDTRGCFGIEVIYPEEDERKFRQMFKLFRLCSLINQVPKRVVRLQRVSAYYREDWHRAIVLNETLKSNASGEPTLEVKFVDLGIRKRVLRNEHVKEIDEKFFNFPLKSVYCTVSVDDTIREAIAAEHQHHNLPNFASMRLSLEAQKFFTTAIYDRVLFAKVIALKEQQPINIKLCIQTNRGIIDIFMFTLSKYDRARYDLIKHLGVNKAAGSEKKHQQVSSNKIQPPVNINSNKSNGGSNNSSPEQAFEDDEEPKSIERQRQSEQQTLNRSHHYANNTEIEQINGKLTLVILNLTSILRKNKSMSGVSYS